MCLNCGLIYLIDRFGAEGYDAFYAGGAYRDLSSRYGGYASRVEAIEQEQAQYAARLGRVCDGYLQPRAGGTLLDVGGSTGVVALELARRYGLSATVLDPSEPETAAARAQGLEAVTGSLENYRTSAKFDVVLLCRSIEHLQDLRGSLLKIRALLAPSGLFYCDIVDYMECCRLQGAPEVVSKIDHCFWLCQETAPGIFGSLGFEIVSMHTAGQPDVLGYLLCPCDPVPEVRPAETAQTIHTILRSLREIESDWRQYGRTTYDTADRLRKTAYRAKRMVARALSHARRRRVPEPPARVAADRPEGRAETEQHESAGR